MAASSDDKSLALYCDFENIALGVRDAKYQKFDISHILERLLVKGSIVVKKAYCDWDRYKNFKGAMHEAAFELIEIPHVRMSGKNSADIRMVVDALDLCYTKSHVDTFVIISGDSDFSPLVSKLRENAKTVIGVGVKNSTSDLLISSCDEFIYYDDLVREIERGRRPASRKRGGKKRASRSTRTETRVEERDEREVSENESAGAAADGATDGNGRWSSRSVAARDDGAEGAGGAGPVTMTLEEAAKRGGGSSTTVGEPVGEDEAVGDDPGDRKEVDGGSDGFDSAVRTRRESVGSSDRTGPDAGKRDTSGDVAIASGDDGDHPARDEAGDEADGAGAPAGAGESDEAPRSKKKSAKRAPRKKAAAKKAASKKKGAKKVAAVEASAADDDGEENDEADAGETPDKGVVKAAVSASAGKRSLERVEEMTLEAEGDEADADEESASDSPEELAQEGLDIVLETALALASERGGSDKLWGSMIKQTLKRRRPGFNESYYGFESFGKMLEEAESRGFLTLEHDDRSGGYIITKISA